MQTEDTQAWTGKLSRDESEECLAHLQALSKHLECAMDAIVKRQLPSLRQGVHLQQASCARLADLRHRAKQRLAADSEPEGSFADSDLAAEINAATGSLLRLNERYSSLLKHSGDTLRLLSGLYRSYRGPIQPASDFRANLQTWSCEV